MVADTRIYLREGGKSEVCQSLNGKSIGEGKKGALGRKRNGGEGTSAGMACERMWPPGGDGTFAVGAETKENAVMERAREKKSKLPVEAIVAGRFLKTERTDLRGLIGEKEKAKHAFFKEGIGHGGEFRKRSLGSVVGRGLRL